MAQSAAMTSDDDLGTAANRRRWSFVQDGPPVVVVAPIFAALLAVWLPPHLLPVAVTIGLGLACLGTAAQVRTWPWLSNPDQEDARATFDTVDARLRAARARQIERDRWR
jgi:hypothetical protein